ncbi:polyubiquitin [Penicillium herquei]|nr:polyubiquitin [Penicillium herquei]
MIIPIMFLQQEPEKDEAMWISFDCDRKHKFAIRLFIGGINSISGEEFTSDEISPGSSSEQDYIVIPEQQRLDGIAVRPGVVKQFVATKMGSPTSTKKTELSEVHPNSKLRMSETPKGRTVEWQMTGRDDIGGVQMQIIPQFEIDRIFAGTVRDTCPSERHSQMESYQPVGINAEKHNVLRTPEELGLREGSMIHVKDMKRRGKKRDKFNVEVGTKLFALRVSLVDELHDILTASQKTLQDKGTFQVSVRIANGPDTELAVKNWEELLFLTQPLPVEFQFQTLRELDISDLRASLESMTGISFDGFRVLSRTCLSLDPKHKIFDQSGKDTMYHIPAFTIDDNHVRFTVRSLVGASFAIECMHTDTVRRLKELICNENGSPPDAQRLVKDQRLMDDGFQVGDYKIKNGDVVLIILNLRGGGKLVPTRLMLGEDTIYHGDACTVVDLKSYVTRSLGLFPGSQVISLNGNPLPDNAELDDYIKSTGPDLILKLSIQASKPKNLGIGAGGNIIQEVHRDTSDARLWDVGSSKILNIHIIHGPSFEELTSLTPFSLKREATYLDSDSLDADIRVPLAVPVSLLEVDQTLPWFHGIS